MHQETFWEFIIVWTWITLQHQYKTTFYNR